MIEVLIWREEWLREVFFGGGDCGNFFHVIPGNFVLVDYYVRRYIFE